MDKGMKKVVNLVTNYMSALCETGGGNCMVHFDNPEQCARVLSMNSHTTNAYPITKEVYNYLLPVYERGRSGAVLLWRLDRRVQGALNCPLGPSFERFGGSEVYAARSHIPMLYERLF